MKWFYNEVDEEFANPYIMLGTGPNIKLSNAFSDGFSSHIGIGVIFELGSNKYNIAIVRSSQSGLINGKDIQMNSLGLNLGISF